MAIISITSFCTGKCASCIQSDTLNCEQYRHDFTFGLLKPCYGNKDLEQHLARESQNRQAFVIAVNNCGKCLGWNMCLGGVFLQVGFGN